MLELSHVASKHREHSFTSGSQKLRPGCSVHRWRECVINCDVVTNMRSRRAQQEASTQSARCCSWEETERWRGRRPQAVSCDANQLTLAAVICAAVVSMVTERKFARRWRGDAAQLFEFMSECLCLIQDQQGGALHVYITATQWPREGGGRET